MAVKTKSSRDSAIETAGELFAEKGYAATGVAEVIERSGTPKGSFYFNFPGGKEELGIETLIRNGRNLESGIEYLAARAGSPTEFLDSLAEALAVGLETSDFTQGCPIATVALETATGSERMREAAGAQFESWERAIAAGIAAGAEPSPEDRERAARVLMLLEGALLMGKVRRSTEPVRSLKGVFERLLT